MSHLEHLGYHCRHRHQRESFLFPRGTERHRDLAAHRERPAFNRASGCWWNCSRASTPIAICSKPRAAEPVIEAFARASSYVSGRRVCVDQDGSELRGTTAGLNDSGFLILRDDDGSEQPDRRGRSAPMLLALDAGNSNITIGAFEETKLIGRWRLRTIHEQTADEWGVLMRNLFALASLDLARVDGIIIASVVPTLDAPLHAMSQRYFHTTPLFVTPDTDIGLKVLYDNPREVGADRVVNGVAAFHRYGGPSVVVDLGTTINFDIVSANAEYLGGMICPGIGMSITGLFAKTARLPMVDLREPERLIGKNTVNSIQSGLYYGFAGLIDGIVGRVVAELGSQHQGDRHRRPGAVDRARGAFGARDQRRSDAGRSGNHMAPKSEEMTPEEVEAAWPSNYFNYFTEVEERFQKGARDRPFSDVAARLGAGGNLEKRRRAFGSGAARASTPRLKNGVPRRSAAKT